MCILRISYKSEQYTKELHYSFTCSRTRTATHLLNIPANASFRIVMGSHKCILFNSTFECISCERQWTQHLINFPIRFASCPICNRRTEAHFIVSNLVVVEGKTMHFTILTISIRIAGTSLNSSRCARISFIVVSLFEYSAERVKTNHPRNFELELLE